MANSFSDPVLEDLVRRDLGIWNFEELIPTFKIIRQLFESADLVGEHWIPNEKRGIINSNYSNLLAETQRIKDLTANTSNPNDIKSQVISTVTTLKDSLLNAISPYVRVNIEEITALKIEVQKSLDTLNQTKIQVAQIIEDWELRQLKERERNVVAGTSEASTFFDLRAKSHKDSADNFGRAAIVTSLVLVFWTLMVGFGPWRSSWNSSNPGQSVLNDLPKLAIITLISFGLGIFVKNYRINQHLLVLNQTKSTTLKAGESFVKSLKDDSTRDIVLETMVKSVFALGETGFLDTSQEKQVVDSPNLSSIIHAIGMNNSSK